MAIFGASRDRNRSFEALRRALSSRGGRESLHALPTGQTIGVIDVLEQVSAKPLGCVITSLRQRGFAGGFPFVPPPPEKVFHHA